MKKVLVVLLILLLVFIWGHSCMSVSESKAESSRVLEFARPFLELFVGEGNVTLHMVRKLAHFTEFGALGAVLALLLPMSLKGRLVGAVCGLLTGFLDETIQFFSDRGDQISDVWLDFSGALTGLLVMTLLWQLWLRLKKRKR